MLVAILVLSFLIFFHELGHFIMARLLGVKVEVFSIGFGKKLFCKKWGETSYCLSAIPLGGYVQMKGQDDTNPTLKNYDKDSYLAKTPIQRILILLGGPLFNILLAFLIYLFIALSGWQKLAPVVGKVLENSPAQNVLKANDRILKIMNHPITTWDDIKKAIKHSTKPLNIVIKRDNRILHLTIKPKIMTTKNILGETVHQPLIGIMPKAAFVTIKYPFTQALSIAWHETIDKSKLIFEGFIKMASGAIGLENVSGPIGIVRVTSKASEYGLDALLLLSALISVNLGVLNLLPIPALDGGHIMFNLYELITKRAVNEEVMIKLTIMGWIFLGMLMVIGVYNDITRMGHG
ncbi:MAG: RIP metalloprotease RseP [Epsilonproteobacteria bacterium]|nr:RIP metalloprotease RseP [Campylobacterota bacterium]